MRLVLYAAFSILPGALCVQEFTKPVVAHFMVGNTYPYTREDWMRDITLAASSGIDGFALNIGSDDWQMDRVADAYEVARASGINFALFPSFDMGILPCQQETDATLLRNFVNRYHDHNNQFSFKGLPVVSTFGGQACRFGQATVSEGWRRALKTGLPAVHYIAAYFMDPAIFGSMDFVDGAFSWDSAWPMGNYDINNDYDVEYRKYLQGKTYMAAVSPWFFTHYGPDSYNKNFIFRADDWLLAQRWEILVRDRDLNDIVQVISWNDYGESHYMGPIEGAQPQSESWTTGYDHQGWLDLQHYYINAYKSGSYPSVERDRVFLWGRLYPANAMSPDPLSRPLNYNFTEDFVWAVTLLTSSAQFRLSCGNTEITADLPVGLSKVRLPLEENCRVSAVVSRNGSPALGFSPPGFNFSTTAPMYNFNAFVAAS